MSTKILTQTGIHLLLPNQEDFKGLFGNDNSYVLNAPLDTASVIFARSGQVPLMPHHVYIGRPGSGYDGINLELASRLGICVETTPTSNAYAVASFTMHILGLTQRNILPLIKAVQNARFSSTDFDDRCADAKKRYLGTQEKGKTIGIIGYGGNGSLTAELALGMKMNVVVYEKDPKRRIPSSGIVFVETLEELCMQSDIISMHVRTENKEAVFKKEHFEILAREQRKGIVLLNPAREWMFEEHSMRPYLRDGTIGHYWTDNPTSISGTLAKEFTGQIIETPHTAGSTKEALEAGAHEIVVYMQRYIERGEVVDSPNFPPTDRLPKFTHRMAVIGSLGSNLEKILIPKFGEDIVVFSGKGKGVEYYVLDADIPFEGPRLEDIESLEGVIRTRVIA